MAKAKGGSKDPTKKWLRPLALKFIGMKLMVLGKGK